MVHAAGCRVANIGRIVGWESRSCGHNGMAASIERCATNLRSTAGASSTSNFSIGVNIFFKLARHAAEAFNEQTLYDAAVHEIHHVRKAEFASGTALIGREDIARNSSIENRRSSASRRTGDRPRAAHVKQPAPGARP